METGSWKWTCWGGAVKREIQIYKTSKKTGKSGVREAPGDIVLEHNVIQTAGAIEKIVPWHNRKTHHFIPNYEFSGQSAQLKGKVRQLKWTVTKLVYSLDVSHHARRYDVTDRMLRGVSLREAQLDELQTVSDGAGEEWAGREASNPLSSLSGWSFHCG